MTRRCTFKEAFIEKQLDKFQPGWRNGENIRAQTKQKIKEYVASKMPEGLIKPKNALPIIPYGIWRKIFVNVRTFRNHRGAIRVRRLANANHVKRKLSHKAIHLIKDKL